MDAGRQQRIQEAAERFARALAQSYETVYGQATDAGEQQTALVREFYDRVAASLNEGTERGRVVSEQFAEQARVQREAAEDIGRESAAAYMDFLNEAFASYQSNTERVIRGSQEATAATSRAATGAVGSTLGATRDLAVKATLPIANYDDLNVDEVSERLQGLSADQLRVVRDYEERNKKRDTVLEELDRRIRSSS